MTLIQLMIPHDSGYETISQLLELDLVHYVDLNKHLTFLPYTELIKRAEET